MNRFALALCSVLLCSAVAVCQDSASLTSGDAGVSHAKMHFRPEWHGGTPVTGAPYSGEEVDENDQTLADGTHISQQLSSTMRYRDSMGRTRTERQPFSRSFAAGTGPGPTPVLVEIEDPVARVRYILDPEQKIAHRVEFKSREDRAPSSESGVIRSESGAAAVATGIGGLVGSGTATTSVRANARNGSVASQPKADDSLRPKTTSEDLGTQTIEGVLVEGRRHTTTYPAGSVGNDRPFTATHEYWRSPSLKLEILGTQDDPRSGQHVHKLINISTSEPDAALFQPPSGYTVKDEKTEFEISWTIPQR